MPTFPDVRGVGGRYKDEFIFDNEIRPEDAEAARRYLNRVLGPGDRDEILEMLALS